jgi:hypothetical protein
VFSFTNENTEVPLAPNGSTIRTDSDASEDALQSQIAFAATQGPAHRDEAAIDGAQLPISCSRHRSAVFTPASYSGFLEINNPSRLHWRLQPLNAANHRSAVRLRTVAELYPEIADAEAGEDPLPSCSAAEALERQEPFINQVLATSALAMLARLFRYGISETAVLVFRRPVNQQGFMQRKVMVLSDAHVDLHEFPPSNRSAVQSGQQAPC